jgi:solute carrier family 25 folate transporter 32
MLSTKTQKDIKAAAGAAIGGVLVTSPLEVIKLNAQVTSSNLSIRNMFRDVYRTHGMRGFYKGLGVSLCGQPGFWVLYFPVYNNLTRHITEEEDYNRLHVKNEDGTLTNTAKASVIFASSLTASMTVNPLFVYKTRFQTSVLKKNPDGSLKYPKMTYSGLVKDVWKYEGIRGLYKGNLVAQIKNTQMVPQMFLYDYFKNAHWNPLEDNNIMLIDRAFVSGIGAKTVSSFVFYPIDVIRTNIRDNVENKSILRIAKDVANRPGGLLNFYRGYGIYWFSAIPTFGLITYGYNKLQNYIKD